MRRIMLMATLTLVMAATMVAVGAAPGFAQAIRLSGPADFVLDGELIFCEGKGVITPSGNVNVQCKVKPVEGNEGGSGGGGATVERGPAVVPFAGGIPVEGQAVETPSGNVNAQGHLHPNQN